MVKLKINGLVRKKKSINNTFCSSPNMSLFREYDVIVSWNYVDLDGKFISKIEMNKENCN